MAKKFEDLSQNVQKRFELNRTISDMTKMLNSLLKENDDLVFYMWKRWFEHQMKEFVNILQKYNLFDVKDIRDNEVLLTIKRGKLKQILEELPRE